MCIVYCLSDVPDNMRIYTNMFNVRIDKFQCKQSFEKWAGLKNLTLEVRARPHHRAHLQERARQRAQHELVHRSEAQLRGQPRV